VADVTLDAAIDNETARARRTIVFVSADVGYCFFNDSDSDFFYTKTEDGGQSWETPVEIDTDTTISCVAFDVWYDQWTPGNSGSLIHIVWVETGDDDPQYRNLDTSDDSFGSQVTIVAGGSAAGGVGTQLQVTIAIGGNLYFGGSIDSGTERFFYRSTNGGTSWGSRAELIESSGDTALMFPAANTGDNEDIVACYYDLNVDELTLKWYDDSANSWTESSLVQSFNPDNTDLLGHGMYSATIRHSDGHILLTAVTETDTATSDHVVFDLNRTSTAFSILEKTKITENIDDHTHPAIFIDQSTDDIYVAYNGARDGSQSWQLTTNVYYVKSTDDGDTWSSGDTAYREGSADNIAQVWVPPMGPRFYAVWRRDNSVLEGNAVNSIDLTATGAFALDCQPGTFIVTGVAATTAAGKVFDAQPGDFDITGVAAGVGRGISIDAQPAAFNVVGFAATTLIDRALNAEPGSFALTGVAATIVAGRVVDAQPGSFTIVGFQADLVYTPVSGAFELNAEPGSFTLTGVDASPVAGRVLDSQPGVFTLTGFLAAVLADRTLDAQPGAFTLTGVDAGLISGRILEAAPGVFAVVGVEAGLSPQRAIVAEPGAFVVVGFAATLETSGAPLAVQRRLIRRMADRTMILGRKE
jgi:hypothetical protein